MDSTRHPQPAALVLPSGPYQAGLEPAAKQTPYRGDWKSGRVGGRNLGSAKKGLVKKMEVSQPSSAWNFREMHLTSYGISLSYLGF